MAREKILSTQWIERYTVFQMNPYNVDSKHVVMQISLMDITGRYNQHCWQYEDPAKQIEDVTA